MLDITFREDESRVQVGQGAENLAILRHLATNLLKQETTAGSESVQSVCAVVGINAISEVLSV